MATPEMQLNYQNHQIEMGKIAASANQVSVHVQHHQ